MKLSGRKTFLLICSAYFLSCERNVTISKNIIHYDPRIHLSAVKNDEELPSGVRELLADKKDAMKFPLSYYLIQEEDVKFFRTQNFNDKIALQLTFIVSGIKYYKLFVHPDSEKTYTPLSSAYRYIGPEDTEFLASPIPGNKTMVVWTKNYLERTPFIVKTEVDEQLMSALGARFPAQAHIPPEMISIIFKHRIKDALEKYQGQQVTPMPLSSAAPQ